MPEPNLQYRAFPQPRSGLDRGELLPKLVELSPDLFAFAISAPGLPSPGPDTSAITRSGTLTSSKSWGSSAKWPVFASAMIGPASTTTFMALRSASCAPPSSDRGHAGRQRRLLWSRASRARRVSSARLVRAAFPVHQVRISPPKSAATGAAQESQRTPNSFTGFTSPNSVRTLCGSRLTVERAHPLGRTSHPVTERRCAQLLLGSSPK